MNINRTTSHRDLNGDGQSMNDLYIEIHDDLHTMQKIINNIGTNFDSIAKRQQFGVLKLDIKQRISELTNKILISSIDHDQYICKLSEKSDLLKNLTQIASIKFKIFKPIDADNPDWNDGEIAIQPPRLKQRRNSTISPIEISITQQTQQNYPQIHDYDNNNPNTLKIINAINESNDSAITPFSPMDNDNNIISPTTAPEDSDYFADADLEHDETVRTVESLRIEQKSNSDKGILDVNGGKGTKYKNDNGSSLFDKLRLYYYFWH